MLVTVRDHPVGRFVGVYNVTPEPRPWYDHRLHELGVDRSVDEITGAPLPWSHGTVVLPPYGVLWLTTPGS